MIVLQHQQAFGQEKERLNTTMVHLDPTPQVVLQDISAQKGPKRTINTQILACQGITEALNAQKKLQNALSVPQAFTAQTKACIHQPAVPQGNNTPSFPLPHTL